MRRVDSAFPTVGVTGWSASSSRPGGRERSRTDGLRSPSSPQHSSSGVSSGSCVCAYPWVACRPPAGGLGGIHQPADVAGGNGGNMNKFKRSLLALATVTVATTAVGGVGPAPESGPHFLGPALLQAGVRWDAGLLPELQAHRATRSRSPMVVELCAITLAPGEPGNSFPGTVVGESLYQDGGTTQTLDAGSENSADICGGTWSV